MKLKQYLFIFISFPAFVHCHSLAPKPLRIALSSSNSNYEEWIYQQNKEAIIYNMIPLSVDSAVHLLASCDGLLLTGGEDVAPGYYGKASDSLLCARFPRRDSLEFALIRKAIEMKIPILGVCRGEQILNVALGGTLITDIPTYHPSTVVHRQKEYTKCFHPVRLDPSSNLKNLCGVDAGKVNSNHHQAVDKIAPVLRVVAWSPDSIAEAIEYRDPGNNPFLMGVQWHPEKLDKNSPLSKPLLTEFLKSMLKK